MNIRKLILISLIGLIFLTFAFLVARPETTNYSKYKWNQNGEVLSPSQTFTNKSLYEVSQDILDFLSVETKESAVSVDYLNREQTKGQLIIYLPKSGDDSIGESEYIYLLEKDRDIWTITDFGQRWKCLRTITQKWTNESCI